MQPKSLFKRVQKLKRIVRNSSANCEQKNQKELRTCTHSRYYASKYLTQSFVIRLAVTVAFALIDTNMDSAAELLRGIDASLRWCWIRCSWCSEKSPIESNVRTLEQSITLVCNYDLSAICKFKKLPMFKLKHKKRNTKILNIRNSLFSGAVPLRGSSNVVHEIRSTIGILQSENNNHNANYDIPIEITHLPLFPAHRQRISHLSICFVWHSDSLLSILSVYQLPTRLSVK